MGAWGFQEKNDFIEDKFVIRLITSSDLINDFNDNFRHQNLFDRIFGKNWWNFISKNCSLFHTFKWKLFFWDFFLLRPEQIDIKPLSIVAATEAIKNQRNTFLRVIEQMHFACKSRS